MHALYTLQIRWLEKHWYLAVSALKITLQKSTNKQHSRALSASDTKLAEYYFNWQNYHEADEDSVAELQLNFMKQVQAWLNADEAYLTLGLEMDASWQTINKRYRSLVQNQHPDKGGNTERFLKIQRAYDQLKQKFNR